MVNPNTNYHQADDNARQIINWTNGVTQRQFSPEETIRIVKVNLFVYYSLEELSEAPANFVDYYNYRGITRLWGT